MDRLLVLHRHLQLLFCLWGPGTRTQWGEMSGDGKLQGWLDGCQLEESRAHPHWGSKPALNTILVT